MNPELPKPQAHEREPTPSTPENSQPSIYVDCQKFMPLLESTDWSDKEKQQYLQAMWVIICGFVDLGFHVHPVQLALDKSQRNAGISRDSTEEMLYVEYRSHIEKFTALSASEGDTQPEGESL